LDRLGSGDGPGNLGAWAIGGDHARKAGVGVDATGAVGDWNEPARAIDERGHFAGGGVKVRRCAAGVFDCVGEAAGFGLLKGELAVSWAMVFAGGEDLHGVGTVPLRQRQRGGR